MHSAFETALDAVGVVPGTRMLDAGCGAGLALRLAADRGADVSGLDATEALLAHARERVPGAPVAHGELESLPYPGDAFDVVTGFNSFQYATRPVAAVREAARVYARGRPRPGAGLGPARDVRGRRLPRRSRLAHASAAAGRARAVRTLGVSTRSRRSSPRPASRRSRSPTSPRPGATRTSRPRCAGCCPPGPPPRRSSTPARPRCATPSPQPSPLPPGRRRLPAREHLPLRDRPQGLTGTSIIRVHGLRAAGSRAQATARSLLAGAEVDDRRGPGARRSGRRSRRPCRPAC